MSGQVKHVSELQLCAKYADYAYFEYIFDNTMLHIWWQVL